MSDPANPTDALEDKLTGIFRLVTDQPDNASHGLKTTLRAAGLSISDLRVIIADDDRDSTFFRLHRENVALREDVRRLRGAKGLSWQEFESACARKVDTQRRDWIKLIATSLQVTASELRTFQKNDRVPLIFLRKLDHVPDYTPSSPIKRRTNFHQLVGKLVNAARKGGMAPGAIRESLDNFLQHFEEKRVTQGMVDGVRIDGSEESILSDEDGSPLTRQEVVGMQTRLWGKDGSVRPMERFFITHIQKDVSGYMKDDKVLARLNRMDCIRLRQRFHLETELRQRNTKYARLSRALGLLEKRVTRRGAHDTKLSPGDVAELFNKWIGPTDDIYSYIAQLCGYDGGRTIRQAFFEQGKFPAQLADTVEAIRDVVGDLDVYDEQFEAKVAANIKQRNRKMQKTHLSRQPESNDEPERPAQTSLFDDRGEQSPLHRRTDEQME